MARKPKVTSAAEQLLAALRFVECGTRDEDEWKGFVRLSNNFAVTFNGQIAAGHPIVEELALSPRLDKLTAAIASAGTSLVIVETPGGKISIKGDKLNALVACWPEHDLPVVFPDPPIAVVSDKLKEAFKVCGVLASEAADRPHYASLLLEANVCTSTSGAAILQYFHGIDLPPGLVIPKAFSAAVAKQVAPLTAAGFSWNNGKASSLTLHFEGGSWLKTQCYSDEWPAVDPVMNVATQPITVPPLLFEAIEAVLPFSEGKEVERRWVTFADDRVMSHDDDKSGAQYEVKGLVGGKRFLAKLAKSVAPWVGAIDLTSYRDRAFFFGGTAENPVRGALIGVAVE